MLFPAKYKITIAYKIFLRSLEKELGDLERIDKRKLKVDRDVY